MERLAASAVGVSRVKQGTGRTPTGLRVAVPYLQQRYILTFPGKMFVMQHSDIDMEYVRSARHLHASSFFLHRALRPRIGELFRQAKAAGLSTSGTISEGAKVSHCYTRAADFTVRLTVDGSDDVSYDQSFTIKVSGELKPNPQFRANRRFEQPSDK